MTTFLQEFEAKLASIPTFDESAIKSAILEVVQQNEAVAAQNLAAATARIDDLEKALGELAAKFVEPAPAPAPAPDVAPAPAA